jgi:hypothetical protein
VSPSKSSRLVAAALVVAGAVAVSALAVAAAPGSTRIVREKERLVVEFPAGWSEQPEVTKAVRSGMLGASAALVGDALAYGDLRAGVFGALMWLTVEQKVKGVRPELEAFAASMKSTLEGAGMKVTRWQLRETSRQLWVDMTATQQTAAVSLELTGVAVGVVDRDGILHGYALQCIRADLKAKQPQADCEAMLRSFALTWADKDLRKLEKK